jgi:hypothetical protein
MAPLLEDEQIMYGYLGGDAASNARGTVLQ